MMRPFTTKNQFQVSADTVCRNVVCRDLLGTMTAEEAIELAAWLLVKAEEADPTASIWSSDTSDDNDPIFRLCERIRKGQP